MNLDRDNHAMRAQFQDAIENLIYGRGWRVMGAILLILILFLADLNAMRILFNSPDMDVRSADALLYSFIFALCL